VFRDSRGVVHTVSSADPLQDVPPGAVAALQQALLPHSVGDPVDVGGVLETADALQELLQNWQDAFFAALPDDVDLAEEARWAAEAGLSLEEVEADWADDEDEDGEDDALAGLALEALDDDDAGDPLVDLDDLDLVSRRAAADPDDPRARLPEPLVTALERELLLLPVRVRLEALVGALDLVQEWSELVADREKLLGHLVLAHGQTQAALGHEALAARHAALHAASGPAHGSAR
jgi:hypothetical protein